MTRRTPCVLVVTAVLMALTPEAAGAQSAGMTQTPSSTPPSVRPWAGLAPGRGGAERFAATVDMFAGTSVSRGPSWTYAFGTIDATATARTGLYGSNASIDYGLRRRRISLAAGGTASARRYTSQDADLLGSYIGRVQLSGDGRRSSWRVAQSLTRSPLTATQFFPGIDAGGIAGLSLVDFQLAGTDQWVSESEASWSLGTRRHRLSLGAGYGVTSLETGTPGEADRFDRRSGSVRYSLRVGRYTEWYAGYGRTDSRGRVPGRTVSSVAAPTLQNLDLGLGFARPLSFSRRTTVSLQTGAAVLDDAAGRARYSAVGTASLQREIGRSWTARLVASRDTRFVTAVFEPVTSTGLTAQLLGRVTQRAQIVAVASAAAGRIGDPAAAASSQRAFSSRAVSAQLRVRMAGAVSAYAEYVYSQADFGTGTTLRAVRSVPASAQGLRVGLSVGTALRSDRSR